MKESATMTFVGYSYNDDEDEDIQEKIENCMQNNDILEEDTNLIPMVAKKK